MNFINKSKSRPKILYLTTNWVVVEETGCVEGRELRQKNVFSKTQGQRSFTVHEVRELLIKKILRQNILKNSDLSLFQLRRLKGGTEIESVWVVIMMKTYDEPRISDL